MSRGAGRAITRRQALGLAGAAAVVGAAGVGLRWWREDDHVATAGELPDPVRRVGERYMELYPVERDADALKGQLDVKADEAAEPLELLRSLRPRIADAFSAGEVVDVDGWVLSVVEVRAAALAALEVTRRP